MRKTTSFLALCFVVALAACNSNNSSPNPNPTPLPTPTNNCTLPASVVAASGFSVHCFAASPSGSTNPDSIVQIGRSVFVGYGDDVNPDGTAGPSGKTTNEIVQYDLSGNLQKTYSVPGHNDGLMAFNSTTL